ncbi:hypothetical protein J6590_010655 [Homalodisca vitripennis]|nr:hypothetical protein J6590_010655 [Homalodisca vitripennis]
MDITRLSSESCVEKSTGFLDGMWKNYFPGEFVTRLTPWTMKIPSNLGCFTLLALRHPGMDTSQELLEVTDVQTRWKSVARIVKLNTALKIIIQPQKHIPHQIHDRYNEVSSVDYDFHAFCILRHLSVKSDEQILAGPVVLILAVVLSAVSSEGRGK